MISYKKSKLFTDTVKEGDVQKKKLKLSIKPLLYVRSPSLSHKVQVL